MPVAMGKIQPGHVVGRCQIVRELGRGGMGAVYLAAHKTLKIDVALKILSPSLVEDNPALAERFIREAQLAARIRHPNVIAVMDADQDMLTGLYFMVQEYVAGGSLSWHLRHGPLPEKRALEIVTGIAHALSLAEENGIVHRDIKPDNIMLDTRGTAKLADLGLAKQALDTRSSLTLGGSFMGTPAYMSPDQARDARSVNTRDDIYSLGATFYECLTGQPPFAGETPYNIMSELLTKPTPHPRAKCPEVSVAADIVCRKMMAKNRQLRYEDAHALVQDLTHVRIYGDLRRNELLAANFEDDRQEAMQQARSLGIETSAEGVAMVPDRPGDSLLGTIQPATKMLIIPRQADYGVFGAAALLILLVTAIALALVGLGPYRPIVMAWGQNKPTPAVVPTQPETKPDKPQTNLITGPSFSLHEKPDVPLTPELIPFLLPTNSAPVTGPDISPTRHATPAVAPTLITNTTLNVPVAIALPVNDTNAVVSPALPAVPAQPVLIAVTAYRALQIAEDSMGETDHTQGLIEISSERDVNRLVPAHWNFIFYQEKRAKHARYMRVQGDQVTEDTDHPITSLITGLFGGYKLKDILPDAALNIDSTQAYEIAVQQLPAGWQATSSELKLARQNKYDVIPVWTVRLWGKRHNQEEELLMTVQLLSDRGTIISTRPE